MSNRCLPISWLNITRTKEDEILLSECEAALASLKLASTSRPIFTVLVGGRRKSQVLRQLTIKAIGSSRGRLNQTVCLWLDKYAANDPHPTVYVDFQFGSVETSQAPQLTLGTANKRRLDWRTFGPSSVEAGYSVGNLICGRVLGPFSDSICYFISDFENGTRGIVNLLAEQARCEPSSDIAHVAVPTVIAIYDTFLPTYDCYTAESKLADSLSETLRSLGEDDPEACVRRHFKQILVVSLRRDAAAQSSALREKLATVKQAVQQERAGFIFKKQHLETLLSKSLAHFCLQPSTAFSFAGATRPEGFSVSDFCYHLGEMIGILPEEKKWMSGLLCPIVSSAIMVASFPPGSHEFPMPWLYEQVFEPHVLQALIESQSLNPITQGNFVKFLKKRVATRFPSMIQGYMNQEDDALKSFLEGTLGHVSGRPSALSLHLYTLHQHRWRLRRLRTFRTCICCLLRTPEKTLECGHSLCDVCIRSIGTHLLGNRVKVKSCPLCGDAHNKEPFRMMPTTAGVRALCVDGGGIKGIIPLINLQHIWGKVAQYGAPLGDYFDFVCGTSAGGLVAMGIFLMGWSLDKCIATFEQLAANTFKHRRFRLFDLVTSYIRDSQYSSSPIERAFKTHFGDNVTMFNPLVSDTKVAVTAVTALRKPHPCIFSNYNGGVRTENTGYTLIRAKRFEDEVNISEAATCTSAAPWFFKPVELRDIGTFQDGGLQHNNPVNLARWEIEALWPDKPTDFMLSMGTGFTDPLFKIGLDSAPARFAHRFVSNSMETMDGEKIHIEYRNGLSEREKERYHRINVRLPYPEPLLSDVAAMDRLKTFALAHLELPSTTTDIMDLMYASMFYFELDALPYWNDDPNSCSSGWICSGHILCRMHLPAAGRRALQKRLVESNSYFLIAGLPVACVDKHTNATTSDDLPFRCLVTFSVPDLDSPIGISMRGLVSRPRTISGLPKSANDLIKAQMLSTPFGRADSREIEKRLPQVPKAQVRLPPDPIGARKRKYADRDSGDSTV